MKIKKCENCGKEWTKDELIHDKLLTYLGPWFDPDINITHITFNCSCHTTLLVDQTLLSVKDIKVMERTWKGFINVEFQPNEGIVLVVEEVIKYLNKRRDNVKVLQFMSDVYQGDLLYALQVCMKYAPTLRITNKID